MFKNRYFIQSAFAFAALMLFMPQAEAAVYQLKETELVAGCGSVIEVWVDTQDADVIAGDITLLFDPTEVKVNNADVGEALPLHVFEEIDGNTIRLSGARFPKSGFFDGKGVVGRLHVTPVAGVNEVTFNFSPDLQNDNNLVDGNINNVLTDAFSRTFIVKAPYAGSFCNADQQAPDIQVINPPSNAGGVPVNTSITMAITDNRSGVDKNSIEIVLEGGTVYSAKSPQLSVVEERGVFRVRLNPPLDFGRSQAVEFEVTACDLNQPANCKTHEGRFYTTGYKSGGTVCGDGVLNVASGEQCDDGNNRSGDGCSLLCLIEKGNSGSASCFDGIHNNGETGIDCGGPCSAACATCVDNIQNQGEEGVDCGGPCPSCGKQSASGQVTICHYPDPKNKKKAYSLLIPQSLLSIYQLKGDTLGPCPAFEQCPQALLMAAPEREKEALNEAGKAIENGVVEKSKSTVDVPAEKQVVLTQRERCLTDPKFANADLNRGDLDGDGLSDLMECLAGFDPGESDTDRDGCSDFEELNHYYSDPLNPDDCEIQVEYDQFSEALITDPKPGWVLSTLQPSISGKAPANAQFVLGVVTSADQLYIDQLTRTLQQILALDSDTADSKSKGLLDDLNRYTNEAKTFLEENRDLFDSAGLAESLSSIPATLTVRDFLKNEVRDELEKIRFGLLKLKVEPKTAIATTDFEETFVGELSALNFEAVSNELADNTLYDLVITVYLNNGSKVTSKAIRFSVNTANSISKPIPRTIGNRSINDVSGLTGLMIGGRALAQNEEGRFEIEINDDRPTITGETEFGSNVFAVWHSVVLASSVISDSEQGSFEIEAPRPLEIDTPHRATLYAVKGSDSGNQLRSESVDVYFRIKKKNVFGQTVMVLVGLLVLGGGAYALRQKLYSRKLNIRVQ